MIRRERRRRVSTLVAAVLVCSISLSGQTPSLRESIVRLGDFEYSRRSAAAREIRRSQPTEAVPALLDAIRTHADEFVRARAFVLLTGFDAPQASAVARSVVSDRNDRLREMAYRWLTRHPDPSLVPSMMAALESEQGEFVRPALVQALAALDLDERIKVRLAREVGRGLDIFRGAVIEALADRRAAYAVGAIMPVAALDGPLQDDAILALGLIGAKDALSTLERLDPKAPAAEISRRAAICLLKEDCNAERDRMARAFRDGSVDTVRAAVVALTAFAKRGDELALEALMVSAEVPTSGDGRDEVVIGFTTIALDQPERMLSWLVKHPEHRERATRTLRDGFDMLEEDLAEETFFAVSRTAYWTSDEGSPTRSVTAGLIDSLGF